MWAHLVRPRAAVLSLPLVSATAAAWQGKHVGCEETKSLRPCQAVWSSALTESHATLGKVPSSLLHNYVNSDAALQDVRTNWEAIKSLPASFRDDRRVVLEAVRQSGWALEFASEALRADRDVVLEAVRATGLALQFASEELRGDRSVVVEAVRQSGWALQYVADNLKNDCSLAAETTGFSSCSY